MQPRARRRSRDFFGDFLTTAAAAAAAIDFFWRSQTEKEDRWKLQGGVDAERRRRRRCVMWQSERRESKRSKGQLRDR